MSRHPFILFAAIGMLLVFSCKKDKDEANANPFDDPALQKPAENPDTLSLEPGTFAYLHHYVFKPTCSNSGCHDGNFEPDFRSISSSYNTLVYHDVIQNDDLGTYRYRVEPGNVSSSFLYVRLTSDIPQNASGKMPLSLEPGSDWVDKKNEYIDMIKAWIENGAQDVFGNTPETGNPQPQVKGILAFVSGNTTSPLNRVGGQNNSPIRVPRNSDIDLWLAVEDDKTAATALLVNELKVSKSLSDFSNAETVVLKTDNSITGLDFEGNSANFTHKATLNFQTDTLGTFLYLRSYFKDEDHDEATEIPNSGSNDVMKSRFSLKVDSL